MKLLVLGLILLADGWLCGFISAQVRRKRWHPASVVLSTAISSVIWALMAKDSSKSLAFMSVLFDVLYAGGYFMVILAMGERLTWLGAAGAALATAGVLMMGASEP
jgi:hypothetical protein